MKPHKRALQQFVDKRNDAHRKYTDRMRELQVTKAILGVDSEETRDALQLAQRAWNAVEEAEELISKIEHVRKGIR